MRGSDQFRHGRGGRIALANGALDWENDLATGSGNLGGIRIGVETGGNGIRAAIDGGNHRVDERLGR